MTTNDIKILLGGVVALILALLLFLGQFTAAHNAAVWASVPDTTAIRLSDTRDGDLVLAYGQLPRDADEPLIFYTAYDYECSQGSVSSGTPTPTPSCSWEQQYTRVEPFTFTLDSTRVQVVNGDWAIQGKQLDVYTFDRTRKYTGLPAESYATVAGYADGRGQVRAIAVYGGTPAEYRQGWVILLWALRIGAAVLGIVSLGMIVLALLPTDYGWRRAVRRSRYGGF